MLANQRREELLIGLHGKFRVAGDGGARNGMVISARKEANWRIRGDGSSKEGSHCSSGFVYL